MLIAFILWTLIALTLLVLLTRAAPATIRAHQEDVRRRRARQFLLSRISWLIDTFTASLIAGNVTVAHAQRAVDDLKAAAGDLAKDPSHQ